MRALGTVMLLGMMATLPACRGPEPERAAPPAAAWPAPPADSPLAKVQLGMTPQEVQTLLGVPSDQNAYVTGKAFIPFYYGRDRHRIAYFYKGLGRVVFAGGGGFNLSGRVSRVEYDPSEPGRAR
jgi:hypothetical protein